MAVPGFESALAWLQPRRRRPRRGELAHDLGDVGAEDFGQLEDGREAGDVAALLDDADVRRRQAGAGGELSPRPPALLADAAIFG